MSQVGSRRQRKCFINVVNLLTLIYAIWRKYPSSNPYPYPPFCHTHSLFCELFLLLMFAEPTLSPHSLGQITITISTLHESRIQGLNIVHPHPESQLLPPRTPVQEGPQLPLRPARRSQNIFDSATSTRAATKLPLSPNNTPIEVEKLACIPDHTQIYQHYFHVPNL